MKRRQFISKTGALALASLGTAGTGLFNLSLARVPDHELLISVSIECEPLVKPA